MRLIKAKEAAELLDVRLPRLYELARLKVVPFVRFGPKQIRFDPDVLAEWSRQGGVGKPNLSSLGTGEVKRDAAQ
jgi:excisionase family DNA binding protein